MGKSEEIKVVIKADSKQLGRELTASEKAILKAKGIVQSASGSIEGSSKSWAKYRTTAVAEMNKAVEGVRKAQEKVRQIRSQIQSTTMSDNDVAPYIQAYKSMNRSPEQIQSMVAEMQKPSPVLQQQYDTATAELERYKRAAQEAGQSVEYLNRKVEESTQAESAQIQSAKYAAAQAKEQARAAREAAAAHKDGAKASSDSGSGLSRFARTAGFAMIGVATLYAGLRKLISAFLEAAKADKSMSTSLGQIKGNLSIAFQSVYQAALPALRALASMLATVTGYLAQFLSMLFGVSWGSAAQGAKDYASTVSGAGGAAKAAAQNLMGLDELNVMQSEAGGGGSGGGGIASIFGAEPKKPQWLIDLVEWLRPIIESLERLWESLKNFIEGVAAKLKDSPGWQKFQEGLTAIRDAIADVIDYLADLFADPTFQALVAGVLEVALYTVGVMLSIVGEGIQLIISLLRGDGEGAVLHFANILIEAGSWFYSFLLTVYHSTVAIFQGLAVAVNTAFADVFDALGMDAIAEKIRSSVDGIKKDIEENGAQYELALSVNESKTDAAKAQIAEWFGGSKEAADTATDSVKAYKDEVAGLKDATKAATSASTDAITKALAETPTVDAASQLGADLMAGFSQGISDNAAMVMNALGESVLAGKDGAISAAKKVAGDAKSDVIKIVKDMTRDIYIGFSEMFEKIHFDFDFMMDAVESDIKYMVQECNKALDSIRSQISINVNVNYTTSGSAGIPGIPGFGKFKFNPEVMARGGIIHAAAGGGGFSMGQLFIAREAGPELVAGIGGGRTAVMNNNQIVESVSNGVYQAVVDAMNSTARGETGDFVVNLDGQVLLRAMRKAERSAGYQLSTSPTFA